MRFLRTNKTVFHKAGLAAAVCAVVLLTAACGGGGAAEASPSAVPTAEPTPVPVVEVEVAVVNDGVRELNVRAEGSTDSEILGTVDGGEMFLLTAENTPEGWNEIVYNGRKAFISTTYSSTDKVAENSVTGGTAAPAEATATPAADASTEPAADATATPEPAEATATPEPTTDPDAPIRVNGSGRESATSEASGTGMTADSIRDKEDPARR